MKQVYKVPFERNSDRVKELRFQFVQRILKLDSGGTHYDYLYVDEAGFNLNKKRKRGRNVIGHCATVKCPWTKRRQHHHVCRNFHHWCCGTQCCLGPIQH